MPVVDSTARYKHLGPGRGKIVIENFDPDSAIDDYRDGLDILVMDRHERPLEFWESPAEDNFLRIVAKNARKRIREFEFEVDSSVVNPMANSDSSGEYLLKIRGRNNYILRFVLTARQAEGGMPEASTTYFTTVKRDPSLASQAMAEDYQSGNDESGQGQQARENEHAAHAPVFDEAALERRRIRGSRIMLVVGIICVIGLLAGAALFVMNLMDSRVI